MELYNLLFVKLADARVAKWSFMNDPALILSLIALYLYGVYIYLPNYMKNRKPYDLRKVIQVYNVVQVVSCVYLVYGMAKVGWWRNYTLGCQAIDYSNDRSAVEMLHYVYWTFILKILELMETCFFILRHKMNQVSKLHVYHHCSTLMFAWVTCKYMGGGMPTFAMILNSAVHVLMYSYYFLSALGPSIQRKVASLKPKITMLQMSQFWILLFHSMQALRSDCQVPKLAAYMFIPNLVILFGFFFNFYVKSYRKSRQFDTKKVC